MLRDDDRYPRECEDRCGESPVTGPAMPSLTGDRRRRHVALTVFYNGACDVCRARVIRYQRRADDRTRLIAWCDVAAAPWALARWQVDVDTALGNIYVLDGHGELLRGAAAIARLWRELPGYRWLGWLGALPGAGLLGEPLYRIAAAIIHAGGPRGRNLRHA